HYRAVEAGQSRRWQRVAQVSSAHNACRDPLPATPRKAARSESIAPSRVLRYRQVTGTSGRRDVPPAPYIHVPAPRPPRPARDPAALSVVDLDAQSGARAHRALAGLHAEPGVGADARARTRALTAHHRHAAIGLVEPMRDPALGVHAAHHRAELQPEPRGDL